MYLFAIGVGSADFVAIITLAVGVVARNVIRVFISHRASPAEFFLGFIVDAELVEESFLGVLR